MPRPTSPATPAPPSPADDQLRLAHQHQPAEANSGSFAQRHPTLLVGLAVFVAVGSVLLIKNRELFDRTIHEAGDPAANSIIIDDAKKLDLLVGNYSRQRFSHPGPAAFYIEAAGEFVFYDTLDVVPAPYNGHAVALLVWNAVLVALMAALIHRMSGSVVATAGSVAAVVAFASGYGNLLSHTWMPYYYFAPFALLLLAIAALAAGQSLALPMAALAGGLLVHGHVEFAFFAPLLVAGGLAAYVRQHGSIRAAATANKPAGWAALGILTLFLLPIVLNLLLHFPGEIDDYAKYSFSGDRPSNTVPEGLRYLLQFWSADGEGGLVITAGLVAAAVGLAAATPSGPLRRFLFGAMAAVAGSTALMWFYAVRGIDNLDESYIGFFYWAAPLVTVLVAVIATCQLAVRTDRTRAAALAVSVGVLVLAGRGVGLVNQEAGDPSLPRVVSTMAAERTSARQAMVITFDHSTWPDVVGVVVNAERRNMRACITDPEWKFMFTEDFVCRPAEIRSGAAFTFRSLGSTQGPTVAIMTRSAVLSGSG